MNKMRKGIIAFGVLTLVPAAIYATVAFAAGNYSTYPQVGMSSFCASTVSGIGLPAGQGPYGVVPGSTQGTSSSICAQTVPAGPPALTGLEIIPADTQATNSSPPQSVAIPIELLDSGAFFDFVPSSVLPATVAIPNNINNYLIDPTTTIASLTLTMPTAPINGQKLAISSGKTVTVLVLQGATGQTLSNAPTALTVSTTGTFGYKYIWVAPTATWFRLN